MRLKLKPKYIDVIQWFKNGDHPKDGDPETEGEVVGYFEDREIAYDVCDECGKSWKEHGTLNEDCFARDLCPGNWISVDIKKVYSHMGESFQYDIYTTERLKDLIDENEISQLENN